MGKNNKKVFEEFFAFVTNNPHTPLVLDADILLYEKITSILEIAHSVVLTPHPKEAQTLFKNTIGESLSIDDIRKNKISIMRKFCAKYPHTVLLLKDCNTFICSNENIYINALGSVSLAKGGSGDVLTGLIASLLAQGATPLEVAITSSVAHATASHNVKNNYALTPSSLIEEIARL